MVTAALGVARSLCAKVTALPAQRGSVTAEAALVIPALVVVLALGLGSIAVAIDEVRCVDAARAGARAAARGESRSLVMARVRSGAPDGSTVSISDGAEVTVTVVAPLRIAVPFLPPARASATAVRESPP